MLSTNLIRRGLRTAVERLLPELCPACGLVSAAGFCRECRATFAPVTDPCPRCGLPGDRHRCPAGGAGWLIDAVRAPFIYEPPIAHHVQALKFGGRRMLGRALGLALAERLGAPCGVDAVVAVPLDRARFLRRRFNQADEIARPIVRLAALPQLVVGIERNRATRPQTDLSIGERRRNVANAFAVTRDLEGLRLAIVDDVMTTGATANALATALLAAGAARVEAWTVARALPSDAQAPST